MITIYLIRHSEPLKANYEQSKVSLQEQNEKEPLSINGEKIAQEKSKNKEFENINKVYASNYVRAIATAKYFTNDEIQIEEAFNERKFGVNDWSELPPDFSKKQFTDFDYKLKNGESLNEVIERETKALSRIIKEHNNERILIVGHSTAIASLLTKWCKLSFTEPYEFQNKPFFDGKWQYCETFKLIFDEQEQLLSIENIK